MTQYTVTQYTVDEIPVTEYVPADQMNQPLPLIFFYHGWESFTEACATHALELVKQGFRVVLPDNYDHGLRHDPNDLRTPLTFLETLQKNVQEFPTLLAYYQGQGLTTDFIGVSGLSMGGITTNMLLTQYPEITAAGALEGTPSITGFIAYLIDQAKHADPKLIEALGLSAMKDAAPDLINQFPALDLSSQPEKLAGRPLLLWHAKDDDIVPVNDDIVFYNANAKNDAAKNLHLVLNHSGGHHVPYHASVRLAAFFKSALNNTDPDALWKDTESRMTQRLGDHREKAGNYEVIG
ncbi:MAG: prolyl oligopeptidase family serine peptidase [Aerococcus sp.]|nr:prolyl oligopeptidase family serine peptidase [Aerococcus sp.]